jgi:ribosomal protein S18 acetylase RimI-like enzyme
MDGDKRNHGMKQPCCEPDSKFESGKTVYVEVRDLIHEAFRNTADINEKAESQLTFFIRDDAGQVVSAAYGKKMKGSEIYVHYLATKKTEREKGYGSSLLYWLVNSENFSFSRIVVNVDKKEKKILGFYRNLGFQGMKKRDRRERNLEQPGEVTFSFHGTNLKKRETPVHDRIEWYDPLRIDYVNMRPGLKDGDPPRYRFHLVMGSWKFECKKWRLPLDLSWTKVELQKGQKEKILLEGDSNFAVIVDDVSGVDTNKENVKLTCSTKDPIDVTDPGRAVVSENDDSEKREICANDNDDDESVGSNKRCKFNTEDDDIGQKGCIMNDDKDGGCYLDRGEVIKKEDEFLTGVEELNQSLKEMEEQLNYILR